MVKTKGSNDGKPGNPKTAPKRDIMRMAKREQGTLCRMSNEGSPPDQAKQ